MHAILAAVGSAGDVNPLIGVARALRHRGHRVTMLANEKFAGPIQKAGVDFTSVGSREQFERCFNDPNVWHWSKYWKVVCQKLIGPALLPTYRAIEAARSQDTVLVLNHLALGGLLARERLGLPTSSLIVSGNILRGVDRPPLMHPLFWRSGGSLLTRLQYWYLDQFAADPPLAAEVAPARRELELPPARRLMHRWILSADKVIGFFPEWYLPYDAGWPKQTVLAGFPRVDLAEQSEMPESLTHFLENGPPPIAFTAGSAMNFGHEFFAESLKVCRELKCRGVFLTGYADHVPKNLPPEIHHARYVPFSQLFSRVRALVHHGGVGTASIALAAGIPQLIIPYGHDQYQHAARTTDLGLADWAWQYRSARAVHKLRRLIESPQVAANCREAAERIRQTPCALQTACDQIEQLVKRQRLSRAG